MRKALLFRVLLAGAVSLAVVGCAHRTGKKATRGALTELSQVSEEAQASAEQAGPIAERLSRGAVSGAIAQLLQPEELEQLRWLLRESSAAFLRGAAEGGLEPGSGGTGAAGGGELGGPAVRLAGESAAAFADVFARELVRQLGPEGDGPLARALAATSERVLASGARGAQAELALPFPECRGEGRGACVERRLGELGYATSAGMTRGVLGALGPWPLVLAFVFGAAAALLLRWAWGAALLHKRGA